MIVVSIFFSIIPIRSLYILWIPKVQTLNRNPKSHPPSSGCLSTSPVAFSSNAAAWLRVEEARQNEGSWASLSPIPVTHHPHPTPCPSICCSAVRAQRSNLVESSCALPCPKSRWDPSSAGRYCSQGSLQSNCAGSCYKQDCHKLRPTCVNSVYA